MRKKFIAILIVILLIALLAIIFFNYFNEKNSLSDEEKKFVGTWTAEKEGLPTGVVTFSSDRKVVGGGHTDKWKVENGLLILYDDYTTEKVIYQYSFSYNNTILTLKSLDNIVSIWEKS